MTLRGPVSCVRVHISLEQDDAAYAPKPLQLSTSTGKPCSRGLARRAYASCAQNPHYHEDADDCRSSLVVWIPVSSRSCDYAMFMAWVGNPATNARGQTREQAYASQLCRRGPLPKTFSL